MIGAGLMHICKKLGKEGCHPDVSKWSGYDGQLGNAENIPTGPVGKELKELDEKCKECEISQLHYSKQECPYCYSIEAGETGPAFIAGTQNRIQLECYKCGLKYWIPKKMFKP